MRWTKGIPWVVATSRLSGAFVMLQLTALACLMTLLAADKTDTKDAAKPEGKLAALIKAIDTSKLPAPAQKKIDFAKDIKPILQKGCMDCHDADGAMNNFRLDKREFALKGGDEGIDIIPGKSEKSPLIFYAARLVKDMEMPPKDQGDPLTKEEVSLLRAWIDQGAKWGAETTAATTKP